MQPSVNTLEAIACLLGVATLVLGVRRSAWNFATAILSVVLVGVVVARERLYSDAILQVFFVAANVYGWVNWSRARAHAGTIVVGTMSAAARWRWLALWVVASMGWGAAMHRFTDASYPWWDAGIAAASVIAQVLMGRRRLENWPIWIAVDVASIPLYLAKGLWMLAGLYVIYLLLSVWGLVDWRAAARRERAPLAPGLAHA